MERPSVLATMAERLGVAESERDEAQAALVALREAAVMLVCEDGCLRHDYDEGREDGCRDCDENEAVRRALAATPATLAGQFRAKVLREAADLVETTLRDYTMRHAEVGGGVAVGRLRALADEAEKAR